MKKTVVLRTYNMSDALLIQLADEVSHLTTRDAAQFATKGWDITRLATLKTARDIFEDHPSDVEVQGARSEATDDKNKARDLLEVATREIFVAVDTHFKNSTKRGLFGNRNLTRLTDSELVRETKVTYNNAVRHQADLAAEGITPAVLLAYKNLRLDLDDKIDAQRDSENERDYSTNTRIELGNNLYAIINDICNIGKSIWYTLNEAKYNDYVIYDAPSASVPTSFTSTIDAGDTGTYFTNLLQANTRINISITAGMDKLGIYVADTKQSTLPANTAYAQPLKPQDLTADDISNGTFGNCYVINTGNNPVTFTISLL